MTDLDKAIRERLALAEHEDWCGDDNEGCNCYLGPVNEALRAVLEIHKPYALAPIDYACAGCPVPGRIAAYPCETVLAIGEALGMGMGVRGAD